MAAEKFFGPAIAAIMGVEQRLLKTQLSSNLWRTVGTTVALSIGLGLFVAMQTWGYTMLGPFVPGDWVPDALVSLQLGGLPDAEIENVRHIKGVIADQCLPLAVEQPRLAEDITKSQEQSSVTRQDNVIMIGLDPQAGLGGKNPLLNLQFSEGDRDDAVTKLKQGRWCIVPDHFSWATGLHVGDCFKVLPPEKPDKPVEYKIAGVVSLPGWHWMTKFSGLRKRSGRSAAMVFALYDDVKNDFQLKRVNFFWMNLEKNAPNVIERSPASDGSFYTVVKNPALDSVGQALQAIADKYLGEAQPVNDQGTWTMAAKMFGSSARITTANEIRGRIGNRADGMIWGMCQLPLITLLVTSIGVINAVMASAGTALGNGRNAGYGHYPIRSYAPDPGRGPAHRTGGLLAELRLWGDGGLVRNGDIAICKLFRRDGSPAGRAMAETGLWFCSHVGFMYGRGPVAGFFYGMYRAAQAPAGRTNIYVT